ncbi:MAG: acetyl-CoA C-acetyltransferase [Planctomycetes bacterium]|nr:acetyl-CoA C-acetyltransferase [Planctomycetota bacterium]
MTDAFLLAGARTPIGKFLGAFQNLAATELGSIVIQEAIQRSGLPRDEIDEVIMGLVVSAGCGQAPARQAALKAGLPPQVAALTINKVCGSGLKAVVLAAQAVRTGDARIVVAGGMENLSRTPYLALEARQGFKMGDAKLHDAMVFDGLWCAFENCHMGKHAEFTAELCGVTRADQDQYAWTSQQRAATALSNAAFCEEIVPVTVNVKGKEARVVADEGPRAETTLEGLSRLRPVFQSDGTVTAGNSSLLSDGAAALVVANREVAERSPAPWKARIVASQTTGIEPQKLFLAPVAAIQKVVQKAGLTLDDIDLFEINEAFAAQMVACQRELHLAPEKVNVNGGAIALGHPIGASGARILVTLLAALKQRQLRYGVASLCLGGGNAVAVLVERL